MQFSPYQMLWVQPGTGLVALTSDLCALGGTLGPRLCGARDIAWGGYMGTLSESMGSLRRQ